MSAVIGHGEMRRYDASGRLHGGPAVVTRDGEEWWWHGALHREDGPAVLSNETDGALWYWRGALVAREEHAEKRRRLLWGLARSAPMLMLWRKRASEIVWHPARVCFDVLDP
jgi:hypothetical protein